MYYLTYIILITILIIGIKELIRINKLLQPSIEKLKNDLYWYREFEQYISNNANDVYNDFLNKKNK